MRKTTSRLVTFFCWMAASEGLTSSEYCVLALLVEAPRHGWGLATVLARDGEIGSIWSMARPLVYTSLRRLEAEGAIETAGIERGDRGPHRVDLQGDAEGGEAGPRVARAARSSTFATSARSFSSRSCSPSASGSMPSPCSSLSGR